MIMVRSRSSTSRSSRRLEVLCVTAAAVALTSGCAHHRAVRQNFSASAPYSKTFTGSGDVICWGVKRALLSQGYMLDRATDNGILTGSREEQPNPKLNVTLRLQTTCADNRNGTSVVFVTATREENQLQKMKQTTSVGVGPATLTMPSGSAHVLGTVRRETIKDPEFYNQFFSLVRGYADQERVSQASRPAQESSRSESEVPAGNASRDRSDADSRSRNDDSRNDADAAVPPPPPAPAVAPRQ
jgi:Uncharacterized protein conserved in bacteria (DUF2242)